jgi:putative endonuclease
MNMEVHQTYQVYIVKCSDGTLYTGISTDVERRVEKHNRGTGAKYTKTRRPVLLLYSQTIGTRSDALKEEYRIKQLRKDEKLILCRKGVDFNPIQC